MHFSAIFIMLNLGNEVLPEPKVAGIFNVYKFSYRNYISSVVLNNYYFKLVLSY